MRKALLIGAAALASLGISTAANAASCTTSGTTRTCFSTATVDFAVSPGPGGTLSAFIGNSGMPSGTFRDIYYFIVDQAGLGSGSVITSTSAALSKTDLDFSTGTVYTGGTYDPATFTFTGTAHPLTVSPTGLFESVSGNNVPLTAGEDNYIVITGTARGNGSYGGQITFEPTPGVPEPATWAMMLFGFGAVGFGMRRRKKQEARVRFAF